MGILERNQKTDIRFKGGDFVLYEPNDIQREELSKMLGALEGSQEETLNMSMIRYILREISSLGAEVDEYSDEELDDKFENITRDGQLFLREIEKLCMEIAEDIIYMREKFVKMYKSFERIIKTSQDEAKLLEGVGKLLKKNGIDLSVEEFLTHKDNPEKIKEIIEKSKIKNNKTRKR